MSKITESVIPLRTEYKRNKPVAVWADILWILAERKKTRPSSAIIRLHNTMGFSTKIFRAVWDCDKRKEVIQISANHIYIQLNNLRKKDSIYKENIYIKSSSDTTIKSPTSITELYGIKASLSFVRSRAKLDV